MLPDSAQSKINRAHVVAVGPGRKDLNGKTVPMSVKAGDTVLLSEVRARGKCDAECCQC